MACNCCGNNIDAELGGRKETADENEQLLCQCCNETVRGKFGLAWVACYPNCPYTEPLGWQVEFSGTAADVAAKCNDIIKWVNEPPLPNDKEIKELKEETEKRSALGMNQKQSSVNNQQTCQCYSQRNLNNTNLYEQQELYNKSSYGNFDNSFQCSCPNCMKEKNSFCTKCKRCPVKPSKEFTLYQDPPDIIKLCPPTTKNENCCKCESSRSTNYTPSKFFNCNPNCPQKSKSHSNTKARVQQCSCYANYENTNNYSSQRGKPELHESNPFYDDRGCDCQKDSRDFQKNKFGKTENAEMSRITEEDIRNSSNDIDIVSLTDT